MKKMASSSTVFILEDVEKLIDLVEARPPLYMRDIKEYSDLNLKKKLWQEICAELFPVWKELDAAMKTKYMQDTQKKWLNLRTCFSRELKLQKSVKAGQIPSKRRKYLYYEKLLFLLPTMKTRECEGNLEDSHSGSEVDGESDCADIEDVNIKTMRRSCETQRRSHRESGRGLEVILNQGSRVQADEDTYFALSLVPQLQSLTEDEKFEAKIGILKLLREIKRSRGFNFSTVSIKVEDFSE